MDRRRWHRAELPLVVLLLVAMPFVLPSRALANEVVIYGIAVLGCSLLLGYVGLLSFGQGIFFGSSAYAAGWAGATIHAGLFGMLAVGAIVGTVLALAVGVFSIRRRGAYFVMLTLAFAQLFYFLAYTFRDFTGGDNGMTDIPRPPLGGFGLTLSMTRGPSFYVFCAAIFLLAFAGLRRVTGSPFGTALVAIRENETRAAALGYRVKGFKLGAFAFSGLLTGLAGALYAQFLGIATLTNIDIDMSQTLLVMTLIGGATLPGSLLGALFYLALSSWLSDFWPRWPMLIGVLLVIIALTPPGTLRRMLRWRTGSARRIVVSTDRGTP